MIPKMLIWIFPKCLGMARYAKQVPGWLWTAAAWGCWALRMQHQSHMAKQRLTGPDAKKEELENEQAKVDCTGDGAVDAYTRIRGEFLSAPVMPSGDSGSGFGNSGAKEGDSNQGPKNQG